MIARVCVFFASAFFGFAFGVFLFLIWAVWEINKTKEKNCSYLRIEAPEVQYAGPLDVRRMRRAWEISKRAAETAQNVKKTGEDVEE